MSSPLCTHLHTVADVDEETRETGWQRRDREHETGEHLRGAGGKRATGFTTHDPAVQEVAAASAGGVAHQLQEQRTTRK